LLRNEMDRSAEIVIVGAGIVGCSVAQHLTALGCDDVVVVEQGPLPEAGGSTSHAPGLVFQTNPSKTMTELASYTVRHLSTLQDEKGSCWVPVGSIEVAATAERWEDLRRKRGFAASWGVAGELLEPEEITTRIPLLDAGKILGGLYVPSDGIAKAVRASAVMAAEARTRGARFYPEVRVIAIEIERGQVRAVVTDRGRIATPRVVCCAGIWGPLIGEMAATPIPLQPMQHQYVLTSALPELTGAMTEASHPILRHQDRSMYFRQVWDAYGVGSYQHRSMPVDADELLAHEDADVMPSVMRFTEEDFDGARADARSLLPPLRAVDIASAMNGVFSFTADGFPLIGESESVRGFWVAEAVWITHSVGVGKAVAECIVEGASSIDLRECDLHRFEPFAHSPAYVSARSAQAFQEVYDIIHPLQPMEEPRPLRVSPFHPRQRELEAVFLESMGWDRPQWFEVNQRLGECKGVPARSGWAARFWSPVVGAEHLATRERVGLFDMTSLKRLVVQGPGALTLLQDLTSNEIDKPPGRVTYTLMLDRRGGIKSDLTVARLAEDRFQVGCNGPLDFYWIKRWADERRDVVVLDITGATCCLGLWGPLARELLQCVTDDDLSNESFGYFRAREIFVREVPVTALRLSYVGELGWELYTSADLGLRLWDVLWDAGRPLGAIASGRGAFDSLRIEKGYRSWGKDMSTEDDPYQVGLEFAVKLDKGAFVGRDSLAERVRAGAPSRRLSCLTIDEPGRVVMGKEPVYESGKVAGFVTSAAYGYSVGCGIAYAHLRSEACLPGTRVEIEYFGERLPATVAVEPLWDPKMERLRS
jgi:glycine cleavage system aminomethyltransferase T/glycine/D-amino acid oxidase-like deaminating enzyme